MSKWLTRVEDVLLGSAMFSLSGTVMYGVLVRYLIPTPGQMAWTEEIGRLLLVWIVWYGAFKVLRKGEHFKIDILVSHLGRVRAPLAIIVDVMVLGFLVVISKEALVLFREQMAYTTPSMLGLPMGLWSLSVLVGGFLMICYLCVHIVFDCQVLIRK